MKLQSNGKHRIKEELSPKLLMPQLAEELVKYIEKNEALSLRILQSILKVLIKDPKLGETLIDILEDQFPQSVLSNGEIKRGIKEGFVIIEPYREDRVQTSSYDVTVGENYYTIRSNDTHPGLKLFNPFDHNQVIDHWEGPKKAITIEKYLSKDGKRFGLTKDNFKNLNPLDQIILLAPGETILAHTNEFIGGKDFVTTMMKARSSMGRMFLSVCKDAGWGDVSYFNRWTLEIQNNFANTWSFVVVGQPIAQVVFFRVNNVEGHYSDKGSYQDSVNLKDLKKSWKPEKMLPKLTRKSIEVVK